jgi:hypothetical protein
MTNLQHIYRKNPNMVSREILGETILVPVRHNVGDLECLYTLNETGAFAWNLFDGENSVEFVRRRIVDEYDVSEKEAQSDLVELIAQLIEIDALERV